MHKTILPIFLLLLLGGVEISDALKTNPVKCLDRKNFPTCYNNNHLYCPTDCPWTCIVDCAKCKPVCLIPSKTNNFTQPPSNKHMNVNFPPPPPPPTTTRVNHPPPIMWPQPPKKQINFPPHMSFQGGYSTTIPPPPHRQMIKFPPHIAPIIKAPPPPHRQTINYSPPHARPIIKGYPTTTPPPLSNKMANTPPPNKQINFPPHTSLKGGGYSYSDSTPPPKPKPKPVTVNTTPPSAPMTSPPGPGLTSSKASSTPRTSKCRNRNYPKCYLTQHKCPPACPDHCEVDCAKCSPVCSCNYPGSVCKDPKFVGADGLTFYFHGKKNQDFCIVSDHNLHINAHFIGTRNHRMTRDFTWIQSIGIRFGSHNLSVSALRTSAWDDASDRLSMSLDGRPPSAEWGWPEFTDVVMITGRSSNAAVIEGKGVFEIKANVVPISRRESVVHGYGIDTDKDCFAHLDLSFKFYSLGERVDGVLGQTYAPNYVSRVKMGVAMPVLGGNDKFFSSSIFATDCIASQFNSST